jgi:hypothetical protein
LAKPGTRVVISDETEKHVKSSYERMPLTSAYYKNRSDVVTAPIDLVPPEMLETRLDTVFDGRGYVLTFRKPGR